jgi:hypothetical protein
VHFPPTSCSELKIESLVPWATLTRESTGSKANDRAVYRGGAGADAFLARKCGMAHRPAQPGENKPTAGSKNSLGCDRRYRIGARASARARVHTKRESGLYGAGGAQRTVSARRVKDHSPIA